MSGIYGNMFDVRGQKEIFTNRPYFHKDLSTNVIYEVYTERGRYLSAKKRLIHLDNEITDDLQGINLDWYQQKT